MGNLANLPNRTRESGWPLFDGVRVARVGKRGNEDEERERRAEGELQEEAQSAKGSERVPSASLTRDRSKKGLVRGMDECMYEEDSERRRQGMFSDAPVDATEVVALRDEPDADGWRPVQSLRTRGHSVDETSASASLSEINGRAKD